MHYWAIWNLPMYSDDRFAKFNAIYGYMYGKGSPLANITLCFGVYRFDGDCPCSVPASVWQDLHLPCLWGGDHQQDGGHCHSPGAQATSWCRHWRVRTLLQHIWVPVLCLENNLQLCCCINYSCTLACCLCFVPHVCIESLGSVDAGFISGLRSRGGKHIVVNYKGGG